MESLVEESQDWWLKDQAALAMGFDNWVDPAGGARPRVPQQDWSMLEYALPTPIDDNDDGNLYGGYDVNDFSAGYAARQNEQTKFSGSRGSGTF